MEFSHKKASDSHVDINVFYILKPLIPGKI